MITDIDMHRIASARNQQLLVDLTSAGEHWTTKGGTA